MSERETVVVKTSFKVTTERISPTDRRRHATLVKFQKFFHFLINFTNNFLLVYKRPNARSNASNAARNAAKKAKLEAKFDPHKASIKKVEDEIAKKTGASEVARAREEE